MTTAAILLSLVWVRSVKPLPAVSGFARANTPSRQHWPSPYTDLHPLAGLAPRVASSDRILPHKGYDVHADKVSSPGPANSVLTCRNKHLRHQASPPQLSATGTHHRYGPHAPCLYYLETHRIFSHSGNTCTCRWYSQVMPNTCPQPLIHDRVTLFVPAT